MPEGGDKKKMGTAMKIASYLGVFTVGFGAGYVTRDMQLEAEMAEAQKAKGIVPGK